MVVCLVAMKDKMMVGLMGRLMVDKMVVRWVDCLDVMQAVY
jgi:hypothetical protein